MSITVFTGLGGQVSLSQAAFAGIGGFTMVNLSVENGWPILLALAVGVLLAGIIGALLAVPALRLGGIFLTMATPVRAHVRQHRVRPARRLRDGVGAST